MNESIEATAKNTADKIHWVASTEEDLNPNFVECEIRAAIHQHVDPMQARAKVAEEALQKLVADVTTYTCVYHNDAERLGANHLCPVCLKSRAESAEKERDGGAAMKRGDAQKFDGEKPMWDLLPLDLVEQMVAVLTYGARKYSADGWKTVPDAQARYWAALLRHLTAHQAGEVLDPESGLPHLAHAATNLMFLQWFEAHPQQSTPCPLILPN